MPPATFTYHYLPVDAPLSQLFERFRTNKKAIFDATRAAYPDAFTALDSPLSWNPNPPTVLRIPAPSDDLPPNVEWRRIDQPTSLAPTLGALLTTLAAGGNPQGSLGVGNTAEERKTIWEDWRNCAFRENVLRRQVGARDALLPVANDPTTDLDDPGTAQLQPDDVICLPMTKLATFVFPAAPSAVGSSATPHTVDLTVGPLEALRAKLRAIKYAYLNLEAMRGRAQKIQVDSTAQLDKLRALSKVASVLKDRATLPLHPGEDDGCGALLAAVDDLIQEASDAMLSPDAPSKVDPHFEGKYKWKWSVQYLLKLLKDEETLKLLDAVLPDGADAPYVADGTTPGAPQTVVEAASDIIAHATFWVAEMAPPADAKALLEGAVAAMGAGKPPSAGSMKDLVAYMSAVTFMGETNEACSGPAPIACCGAVANVYTTLSIAEVAAGRSTSGELDSKLQKLDAALARVLTKQVFAKLGLTGEPDHKTYAVLVAQITGLDDEQVGAVGELTGESQEVQEKAKLARNIHEAVEHASGEAGHEAKEKLVSFDNPRAKFGSLPKVVGSLRTLLSVCDAIAYPKPMAQDAKPKDVAKTLQSSVDAARETIETLKELGVVAESDEELVNLIFGRLSLVMGAAIEVWEAIEAFEGHDYVKATGSGVQSVALILFLVGGQTGGVTVVVGVVVLAVGILLSSRKELGELFTPQIRKAFEEVFKAFKSGNAGHFPELKEPIENVETALNNATLRDFNKDEYEAYEQRLQEAGLRPDGSFA